MSLLFSTGAIAGSAAKGAPGMVLLKPTSITHSGTSASIGANGQVTFTAVTSLSLNGVFGAGFDNYVLAMRCDGTADEDIYARYRVSSTDASGSNYTNQSLAASSTSISASRATKTYAYIGATGTGESGFTTSFYGPFLAQPTAHRMTSVSRSTVVFIDAAGTHSLSTSYDGITLYPNSGNITGALQVYGVRS